MSQHYKTLLCGLTAVIAAHAHFTFIIPFPGGEAAEMILGETLSGQDTVNPALAAGARLQIRDAQGKVSELKLDQDGHRFVMQLPGRGQRVVYGNANLGVAQRGADAKPHLLLYYPKAILGSAFEQTATVGGDQVVELVPVGEPGRVKLLLLAHGKPQPDAEITVILPDGKSRKEKTDGEGMTAPLAQSGRYGAWARFWENKAGELDGKRYEQVRHYAMLVFDSHRKPVPRAPLPEKTSSFGAVVDGAWLYVYGGHIARTHNYSTQSVSGRFTRMNLESGHWEALPAGPGLQGLNLVAHRQSVCRVGGMQPRNQPSEKAANYSIAEVACFANSSRTWQPLPALPEPRSSHDVAVIGDRMIVTGGWTLRGAEPLQWAKTTLVLDLDDMARGWRATSQPFERRALVTAVHGRRMYVAGGITPSGKVSSEVDIYDPASDTWSKGPSLPGAEINGFAPAAAVHGGKLYVSVGDGSLYLLDDAKNIWIDAGQSAQRLAHRMVSTPNGLLILGGAVKGENLDLMEEIVVR